MWWLVVRWLVVWWDFEVVGSVVGLSGEYVWNNIGK